MAILCGESLYGTSIQTPNYLDACIRPPADATYLIDPTLRREFQTLKLRAAAATPGPIEWSVAGRVVGQAEADQAIEWPVVPGRHRIVARDRQGRTAEATVTVR